MAHTHPTYLAIDIGASSGRAVVGTLEDDRMQTEEVHRFPTPLVEANGHLYWDIDSLWAEICRGLTNALQIAPGLRSISVDSWAVDYVPLDGYGIPLRRPYAYRDARTVGRTAQAIALLGADTLYARTGMQFLDINTLPQILSDLADEPALVERTATRLLIADYFLYRLGGSTIAERTMASTTQLADAVSGRWAEDIIRALGDDPKRWPEIVQPGTTIGVVRPELCSIEIENRAAIVASCSHDTAAAVAAVPATGDESWAYISSGTWSLVGVELDAPVLTPAARAAGFTNEAGLDGTVRFLKNRTGMWVLEECVREWTSRGDTPRLDDLLADAAAAPRSVRAIDLNTPAFIARGDMVYKIQAACKQQAFEAPSTRGGLVRLILDSLAESYRLTLEELEPLIGRRIDVIHVVGGGARNALLNQLTADACGRRVIAGPHEATVLGNLIVQARTMGDLSSSTSVRDVARRSTSLTEYLPTSGARQVISAPI